MEEFIVHGPLPFEEITNDSLGKQLYNSLMKHKHLPAAFISGESGKTISYQTIMENSCQLGESLRNFGIGEEEIVGIFSENNLNYFCPILASFFIGNAVTLFNFSYSTGELIHNLNISKPTILFCTKATADKILEVKKEVNYIRKVIIVDTDEQLYNYDSLKTFLQSYCNKLSKPENFKLANVNCDAIAVIPYSSGTTGLSKGVMLTHKNISSAIYPYTDCRYVSERDGTGSFLAVLPFYHCYGLIMTIISLLKGRHVVVLKSFNPETYLKCIEKYKIRRLSIVPTLAKFLVKSPLVDKYNLSSIEIVGCGAATLSQEIHKALQNKLNNSVVYQGYGLTESTLALTGVFLSDKVKPGSSGRLYPTVSAKVIDVTTGKSLGPGQKGELCFKGTMIMKGYCNNIKATEATIDREGWLHTGDIGYYDIEGYFYIVDRLKELIKYKGFQVPPAELEAILLKHPKISDAGVVGIPDDTAGELPVAFVVPEPHQALTEKEVEDFVAKQVSFQKRLHGGVKFVKEIPRNPSGKILRRKLREILVNQKCKL